MLETIGAAVGLLACGVAVVAILWALIADAVRARIGKSREAMALPIEDEGHPYHDRWLDDPSFTPRRMVDIERKRLNTAPKEE